MNKYICSNHGDNMRKIKIRNYFDSVKAQFKNQITMTNDEGHFYLLWDAEAMAYDGRNPLFKEAKTKTDEIIIFANMALDLKGHPALNNDEIIWMLDNIDTGVRQT